MDPVKTQMAITLNQTVTYSRKTNKKINLSVGKEI